jgi:hypothetical protein
MIQAEWDDGGAFFIHNAADKSSITANELPYGITSIVRALRMHGSGSSKCFVFHSQTSLPLLLLSYLLCLLVCSKNIIFVYDIHDLHEAKRYPSIWKWIRYGIVRHYILLMLEAVVTRHLNVRVITVSSGLSNTVARTYRCPPPSVVHSAPAPKISPEAMRSSIRLARTLLFFGTPERMPRRLIDAIGAAGFELHLYGRFNDAEANIGRKLPKHVKVFGEYRPDDLNFLMHYDTLILFAPENNSLNFRYSLPNKAFQSISHGISIIVSKNFEELSSVFSYVKGSISTLDSDGDLEKIVNNLTNLRSGHYWDTLFSFSKKLHNEAKLEYTKITKNL